MYKYYPQPTIIGTGLTGLLISLALSESQIPHVLIGGPPSTDGPRLGESLNVEASMKFVEAFPELADCYYEKEFARFYLGDFIAQCDLIIGRSAMIKSTLAFWGKSTPEVAIHVDRIRFDAALYEKVTQNPYCTHLDTLVTNIESYPGSDRIHRITLQEGDSLPVSHLFDATNHVRFIARQLDLPYRTTGEPQQIVHTHYQRGGRGVQAEVERDINRQSRGHLANSAEGTWLDGSNILRLYQERDGIDGLAWAIPMGDTLSVGLSTPLAGSNRDAETYLKMTQAAFKRYGVDYQAHFPISTRIAKAKAEFYAYDRAYGANWLLAGFSHSQVWWPTSSGLDTSVAAANIAVDFLKRPQQSGAKYQTYMETLHGSQDVWNWAASHAYDDATKAQITQRQARLFWSTAQRLWHSLRLERTDLPSQLILRSMASMMNGDTMASVPAPACSCKKF